MTRYVVGFGFTGDMQSVLLVKKNRPVWQDGLRNGLGGKIEPGETPREAMSREFREECGVSVPLARWRHFATLHGTDFEVHLFATITDEVFHATTTTDESVGLVDVARISTMAVVPNLRWLVPMALDTSIREPLDIHIL